MLRICCQRAQCAMPLGRHLGCSNLSVSGHGVCALLLRGMLVPSRAEEGFLSQL